MCVSAMTALQVIGAAMTVSNALNKPDGQQAQVPTPAAPPQAAKTPAPDVFKKKLAAMGGSDSTALTGPGGIPNEKLLLGKATVLGA